jgi:hypothetical protein
MSFRSVRVTGSLALRREDHSVRLSRTLAGSTSLCSAV